MEQIKKDYLDLLKKRYVGKSLELILEESNSSKMYCKIEDFRLFLLDKIEVRFSEVINIERIQKANYERLEFVADERRLRIGETQIFDIIKYQMPLTRVEYNFINIIPDDDYDEIKRNALDLIIIHKHNGSKNIESNYNGNITFALGSGCIKY